MAPYIEFRDVSKAFGDNVVLEVPLQASEAVGRGSLGQRAFDAATELVINLFRAGVQKL